MPSLEKKTEQLKEELTHWIPALQYTNFKNNGDLQQTNAVFYTETQEYVRLDSSGEISEEKKRGKDGNKVQVVVWRALFFKDMLWCSVFREQSAAVKKNEKLQDAF